MSSSFIVKPAWMPYILAASIIRPANATSEWMTASRNNRTDFTGSEMENKSMQAALVALLFFLYPAVASRPKPEDSPARTGEHQRRHRDALRHQENRRLQTQRSGRRLSTAARRQSGAPGALVRRDKTDQRRRWHGGAKSALQGRRQFARRDLHADHAVQSLRQRQDPGRQTAQGSQDRHLPFRQLVGFRRALYGESFGTRSRPRM